jgi:hypothetical protein
MSDMKTVIVEEQKATREVESFAVAHWQTLADRPTEASYRCPKCHRRTAGPCDTPHRHTCGAMISIEPRQEQPPEQSKE